MPTSGPVPTAAMRRGKESEAPGIVTRTGRIAWTPWLGRSFIARKSKPSVTYSAMIGRHVGAEVITVLREPVGEGARVGGVELHRRVWAHVLLLRHGHGACRNLGTGVGGGAGAGGPPKEQLGAGQFGSGGLICVSVRASIESNRTSALRPTLTFP